MKILWLLGSMASGKTTQHKLLIELLGNGTLDVYNGCKETSPYCFSVSGEVASLGLLKEGVQTCGIDPVYGDLKKDGLRLSIAMAQEKGAELIIMEGAQASMEWYKQVILPQFATAKVYVVHLSISYDHNLQRLRQRRWLKTHDTLEGFTGSDQMVLEDRTYDNVLGKNKQYRSLFKAMQKLSISKPLVSTLEIDALNDRFDILEQIAEFIYNA
jgi:hypothetical protein